MWHVGSGHVDPELHAQAVGRDQLLLERSLRIDAVGVPGELRDFHAASLDSTSCAFAAAATASRREKNGRRIRKLRLLALVMVLGLLSTASFMFGLVTAIASQLPQYDPAHQQKIAHDGYVYDRNGQLLAVLRGKESRVILNSDQIAPIMKQAIVSIEDKRFYEHKGVDLHAIGRALLADVEHKSVVQGGSTITQQFIKNAYVADNRSIARKLKEAALAWQLEQRHRNDKDWILTAYLNTIYFGNGAYGIGQAALTYFQKPASKLTLPEAALLSGIPRDPSLFDPVTNPKAAKERRRVVLDQMLQQGLIAPDQYHAARSAAMPAPEKVRLPGTRETQGQYFVNYVKQQLISDPEYGPGAVFGGGLRIHTTLDVGLQKMARKAIGKVLADPKGPQAALVAIEPKTGKVLAMVGGSNYRESQFNLAVQGERQPGSAFKPFVLATALDEGSLTGDAFHLAPGGDPARGQALGGEQLRGRVPRLDRPPDGDGPLGQLGVRAADVGRGPAERRAHGAKRGHPEQAEQLLRDRARRRGREPARDGACVRDVRQRGQPDRRLRARQRAARDHADRQAEERGRPAPGPQPDEDGDPELDPAEGRDRGDGPPRRARRPARQPARPGRPRTTATPGSSVTCRSWSWRSGSGTRASCGR